MIVVVSDVHLGSDVGRKCKRTGRACEDLALDPLFQTFMGYIGKDYLQTKEDRLILLGDIFDFWRKDAAEVLIENQEAISMMKEIARRCVINYVVGNHDYSVKEMWRAARTKNLFSTMDKSLHLDIDGDSFTFIHGHQLEVLANPYDKSGKVYDSISALLCSTAGVTGTAASTLWSYLNPGINGDYMRSMQMSASDRLKGKHNALDTLEKLAQSKSRFIYTGADGWLVYGHTHSCYVDEESRTANTGSWGRNGDDCGLDYMIIEKGKPKLCAYEI